MHPYRRAFISLLLILLGASPAAATRLLLLDTPTLAQRSEDIVVGHVLSTRSYWNAEHSRIFTDVVIGVDETWKGAATEDGTLTLTQLGGHVDGAHYNVPGSPSFTIGEEALLFVYRGASGRAQVNGMAQGKFEIRTDAATGEKLVQRMLPGLAIKDLSSLAPAAAGDGVRAFKLSEFKDVITSALQSQVTK